MDREAFKKEIDQGIQKLEREQVIHFAWRCAVRALPFLGRNGNFNFWKMENRQKHLYAIFYALDVNITYADAYISDARAITRATRAAKDATYAYTSENNDAAYAAAYAAKTAYANTDTYADAYAAYAACNATYNNNNSDLTSIILLDLKNMQSQEGKGNQTGNRNLYGIVWDNFQKALEAEGCSYWGRLYQQLFDNNLELDEKAIEAAKQRVNVPKEIREKGAAAVAKYLEALEKGAERLNEARIIILGEKGAGKTCLARRLKDPSAPMTTDKESTAGVDTSLWKLDKENINVHIWDFAGHTVTHAVHQFFLSERSLYIIVYDGRAEERNRLEYWLNHIKIFGGDSKAMILVNKRDQHSIKIPINTLKKLYPIEGFYTFSIRDDVTDLEAFRKDVARYINNNPSWSNQLIPSDYYKVKEVLEKLFVNGKTKKGKNFITKVEFDNIAKENHIDNIDSLLNDLHALGVSLWYKDMEEFDTLVLNPEWISHGVYNIINWVSEEKKYSLTLNNFSEVFKEDTSRYPKDKHPFLFTLMKHYELAYETQQKKCLIIPHLLQEDEPEKLPEFSVGDSLMLRYKAEQPLPPNTISRFIVRHNQEIKKEGEHLVWRYGVILEDGKGSLALVREDDRTISVSVKGPSKTDYISTLRETLNDIFNSYKSDKPELQYRIERYGQIPEEVEIWLSDKKIVNHVNQNVPYFEDITGQLIDLINTVKKYKINIKNLIIGGIENQIIDKSTHNTFNFSKCNIDLQGNLNFIADLLKENNKEAEANELRNAAQALKEVKKYKNKEEIKETGIVNRLKDLAIKLGDKNSNLCKAFEGIGKGLSIAKDIAKGCIAIINWLG